MDLYTSKFFVFIEPIQQTCGNKVELKLSLEHNESKIIAKKLAHNAALLPHAEWHSENEDKEVRKVV